MPYTPYQTVFKQDDVVDWTNLALDISQLRFNGVIFEPASLTFVGETINFMSLLTADKQNDITNRTLLFDFTDDINEAAALAVTQKKALEFPAGSMRIDGTLWPNPEGVAFSTVYWIGQGSLLTRFYNTNNLTTPGINIQRVRFSYFKGFGIEGGNTDTPVTIPTKEHSYTNSAYVASGFRDSRYSPQCGISIDAGISNIPPDGGYDGFTYLNSVGGSAGITFEDIRINRQVIGLMLSPDPAPTSQGDQIRLYWCNIGKNKISIANGQSQARVFILRDCNLSYFRTAYDGLEYGQGVGSAPIFDNVQYGPGWECIAHSSTTNPLLVIGGRLESVHRLGHAGTGSATGTYPCSFIGVDLQTSVSDTVLPLSSPPTFWEGFGQTLFKGCYIGSTANISDAYHLVGDPILFENGMVKVVDRFKPFIGGSIDYNNPVILRNSRVIDTGGSINYSDDETRKLSVSGRVSMHWSGAKKRVSTNIYEFTPASIYANTYVNITTISNWVYDTTTVSFDATDTSVFLVGDIILATFAPQGSSLTSAIAAGYKVTGIAGSTVTCDRIRKEAYYSGEDGTATAVKIMLHVFAPGQALTGDTNSNTTLSNVSPITILRNGDWLTAAAGLPSFTRVVSGGGTATIILNKNATDTAVGKTLYQGRLNTVGLTPAF